MDVVNRNNAEILRHLSSGIVSKGVYLQQDLNNSIHPRNILIKIPDNVHFKFPSISETAETFEFSNQEIFEKFTTVLNNGGKSLAASFFSKLAVFLSIKKQDTQKLESSKDSYFRKWSCRESITTVFVPTAAVQIESTNRCKLSASALHKLQKLESCFQNTGLNEVFINKCEDFFKEFGSHYFIGTYHLGGRRKESRSEEVKDTKEEKQEKHDYYSSSKIKLEKFGGSTSDDNIGTWKRSLVGKKNNWVIIDKQESFSMNYRAVWTLIDALNFNKPSEFSDALQDAWSKLTGLHPETDGTADMLENEVKDIENKIEKEIFLLNCTKTLSIQTGRKTTVSDMIRQVKNNGLLDTGQNETINETSGYNTGEDFEIITSQLFEDYLVDLDKTGDVQGSVGKLLERKNLASPKQEVVRRRYDITMDLSNSDSEEVITDSSDSKEIEDITTIYECHANCKNCQICKWLLLLIKHSIFIVYINHIVLNYIIALILEFCILYLYGEVYLKLL